MRRIIVLQATNQASLRADAAVVFKVVDKDRFPRIIRKTIIESIVVAKIQVCLAPVEVTLGEGHFLCDLDPVASRLERISDVVGVVATARRKSVGLWLCCSLGCRCLASRPDF